LTFAIEKHRRFFSDVERDWGGEMDDQNRALLVLVDSRQQESYAEVEPAFIAALDHWGMPHRRHDLADGQPSTETLRACAAVLVAQQNLCTVLTDDTAQAIAEAVADGLGYIGCDPNVGYMAPPLQHMLAVRAQDVQPVMGLRVVDAAHWVSLWQVPGEAYRFMRPLEMACTRPVMPRVRVLLESDGHPALWVSPYGRGRVVQWALPPGIWRRDVFGHCEGLDDLLWRGIVWAARKPFAMLALPPFSTACVGDAIGAHDFAWVESLSEHGFLPNIGIFPDDIDALSEVRGQSNFADRTVDWMRRYAESGTAEFSPHAATWNRSYLLYGRADGTEIPARELEQRLAAVDKQFARYGIPWARTVNPHRCQVGRNAMPFLEARGVQFTLSGQYPGETWEMEHRLWDGAPYGHPGFTIAPLPGSVRFFVVTSGRPYHDAVVFTGPDTCRLREHAYLMQVDPMWGRTRWQNHSPVDDWDAIASAAVRQIRLGLNALFFACPSTHEQTVAYVRLEEWASLWKEVDRRTARYERWPALYSDVAVYARARHGTRLQNVHWSGTSLACELEGCPDVPLYLTVWNDFGDSEWVGRRYERVEPFEGSQRIVFSQV
jgi:hypothetical protein